MDWERLFNLVSFNLSTLQKARRRMMKTLNDYMAMSYRMEIVEDKDEGGFVVSYPDLPS